MKLTKTILAVVLVMSGLTYGQTNCGLNPAVKTNFYDGVVPTAYAVLKPSGNEDGVDSQNLKQKIQNNRGKLILLKSGANGNIFYLRDVKILSNTHIRVASDVVLRTRREDVNIGSNVSMFLAGVSGARIYNFTISSIGNEDNSSKRFTVEMRQLQSTLVKRDDPSTSANEVTTQMELSGDSFIRVANAENFKLSNFNIVDNYSRISSMTFSLNEKKEKNHFKSVLPLSVYPEIDRTPTKGYIKNITGTKSHVGYGLVQIQAGERLLFENLTGTGGVPLRVETGLADVMVTKDRTVDGIYGMSIKSINGLSAVDVAPHNVDQGCVDMRNISSVGSVFTIRLDKGYPAGDTKDLRLQNINSVLMSNTSTSFYSNVVNHKFTKIAGGPEFVKIGDVNTYNGTFNNVKLKNISGKGGSNAQMKSKFLQLYDINKQTALKATFANGGLNDDMESVPTKSLGVIKYTSDPTLEECNCNGRTPSENGCFSVKIAKSNNTYVELKRRKTIASGGFRTVGFDKIINKGGFYSLPATIPTSSNTYPGYSNSKRPFVVSGKVNDQLSGNKVAVACGVLSPVTATIKTLNTQEFTTKNLEVYPNPTTGLVYIKSYHKGVLYLYNNLGYMIKKMEVKDGENILQLSDYKVGVYYLKIESNKEFVVKKIMLKN